MLFLCQCTYDEMPNIAKHCVSFILTDLNHGMAKGNLENASTIVNTINVIPIYLFLYLFN